MAITSEIIEATAAALIHAERDLYPTLRTRITPHECAKVFRGFWLPREFLDSFSQAWQRQEVVNVARILTSQRLLNGGVFARLSAAIIHGVGILHGNPDVHIQLPDAGSRRRVRMPPVRLSSQRFAPAVNIYRHIGMPMSTEVWDFAGLPTMSRRATVAESARFMPSREAIVVGSGLLRQEVQFRRGDAASLERAQEVVQEMRRMLENTPVSHRRRRGLRLLELMNPACESPAEGSFLWALHALALFTGICSTRLRLFQAIVCGAARSNAFTTLTLPNLTHGSPLKLKEKGSLVMLKMNNVCALGSSFCVEQMSLAVAGGLSMCLLLLPLAIHRSYESSYVNRLHMCFLGRVSSLLLCTIHGHHYRNTLNLPDIGVLQLHPRQ